MLYKTKFESHHFYCQTIKKVLLIPALCSHLEDTIVLNNSSLRKKKKKKTFKKDFFHFNSEWFSMILTFCSNNQVPLYNYNNTNVLMNYNFSEIYEHYFTNSLLYR